MNTWALTASVREYFFHSPFGLSRVRNQSSLISSRGMEELLAPDWDARRFLAWGQRTGLTAVDFVSNSVAGGWYAVQLHPWLHLFRARHHVLIFEEMTRGDRHARWKDALTNFLGIGDGGEAGALPHINALRLSEVHSNKSREEGIDLVRAHLDAHYEPHNELLCVLLERWNYANASGAVRTYWNYTTRAYSV